MVEMRSINKTILIHEIDRRSKEIAEISAKFPLNSAQDAVGHSMKLCRISAEWGALMAVLNSLE